jgi:23S rRNA (adenine2503-C2)-methyltransferase
VDAFVGLLESRNIIVNVRRSRGKDIDAACGQLANKNAAAAPQLKEG